MAEYTLKDVLDEVLRQDFSQFDASPEHKFSLRHKHRMKKIFSAGANSHFEKTAVRIPIKKRLMIALVLVLLMAFAGLSAVADFGGTFIGSFGFVKNAAGLTSVVSVNRLSEPNFISEIYKLGTPPEGYVYDEYWGDLDRTFTFYRNGTNDDLFMMQSTKEDFLPEYDSSVSGFTETSVGGMSGYYSTTGEYTELVWDNGEYIFSLSGKFTVEELTKAAESLCVDTNYRMGCFSENNFENF